MLHRNDFAFGLAILLRFCFIFFSITSVYPQSSAKEKPKIKHFGSSLKEYDKKNKDKPSSSRPGDTSSDGETIKIKTDLVTSNVLVVDQKGNAILGLKQGDFIVNDNGVKQEIGMFSYGENTTIPRSIVLILDYSGSLFHYLDTSIEAARRLVDKLGPQDRMAVVTDDVKLLVDFTKDKDLLKKQIKYLLGEARSSEAKAGWYSGHSLQYSALLATLRELFDEEDIAPIVIFQTDGDQLQILTSTDTARKFNWRGKGFGYVFDFGDVLAAVEKSRATIYSIIPGVRLIGLSEQQYKDNAKLLTKEYSSELMKNEKYIALLAQMQLSLAEVANLSGGSTNFLEKAEDADRVYSRVFDEVNRRYLIGYYPNTQRDGKRHTVKIEVRGHPEYTVIGRKTYISSVE